MKRSPINKISDKRKKILAEEEIEKKMLLEACEGKCMECGKYAPLEKSHNRPRTRFILVCRECHSPKGRHKYLDDY